MNLSEMLDRVKAIDIDEIILGSAMELSETIVALNSAQLLSGYDSDGKTLEPEYRSKKYAEYKKGIGAKPPKGIPDLYLTGDFQNGMFAKLVESDTIVVDSTDYKASRLEKKYGAIFGLDDESIGILNKSIIPKAIKKFKDELTK